MKRTQRFSLYQPLKTDGTADSDVLHYEPAGSKFRLGIYPRLSSGFPDISGIEIKTRIPAPPNLNFTRGGMSAREIGNEPFYIFAIGIAGGILEADLGAPTENYQAVAIIANKRGEVVKTFVGTGNDVTANLSEFANYALLRMDFDKTAKAIEPKHLVTKIHPVNEETLTHTFTATASIPGGGSHEITGNVKAIRDAGGTPDAKFSYWKRGFSWPKNDTTLLIVEDFTGKFHCAFFSGSQKINESHCSDIQTAITTANGMSL